MLFINTETTGLGPDDEIVEIAIVDENGKAVLDTLVKPVNHTAWSEAQYIHKISPEMVNQAPTYDELKAQIREIVRGEIVIIYNKDYDCQYIGPELADAAAIHCCMLEFAEHYGEWNDYYGNYRWQKLTNAANYVCHNWQDAPHRAKSDCLATRSVWTYLKDPFEQQRVNDYKQEQEDIVQAKYTLKSMEHEAWFREKNHYEHMTRFLQIWWLKANTQQHWSKDEESYYRWDSEVEETYSKLFYGKSIDQLYLEDSATTIYRKQKDIPSHLVSKNWFRKNDCNAGLWFTELLRESGSIYAGDRTAWPLYEKLEYERIKAIFPLRLARIKLDFNKETLITKTKAKQLKINLEGIEPVLEQQTSYGDWYYLYKVEVKKAVSDEK